MSIMSKNQRIIAEGFIKSLHERERGRKMTKLTFELVRPAKKSGGDRYEYGKKETNDLVVIYIPQFISRKKGVPKQEMVIVFDN